MAPEELIEMLDAGRAYDGGRPPATLRYGETEVPNFRKNEAPQTILGAEQKAWFLRSAAEVQSDLEGLGQHHGDAGNAG